MKIRQGFVSNSSTTSFTCDVCGRTEAYHDSIHYTDLDFFKCENGHGLYEEHRIWHEVIPERKRDLLLAYMNNGITRLKRFVF